MLGFIAGIVALVAALYIPGALLFRALGFSWLHALVAAPLFTAMMIGVLPIAYYKLGISCTVVSIMGPTLLLAAAVLLVSFLWRGKKGIAFGFPKASGEIAETGSAEDWKFALPYVVCGIVMCTVIFGFALPTPDAAYIRYDNQTHLGVSKSFLDSGMWSSLHPNRYLDLDASVRPFSSNATSFYPSLLYALSALDALMAGLSVTAAFNAVLFTLCAVVFPLGMFAIMRVAFNGNRMAIALGAVALAVLPAFPWGVFIRGLFPNVIGFCLMVPAIGSTMTLLSAPMNPRTFMRGVALWVCAMPALALAQPNAVFTAFVFITAFVAHVVGDWRAKSAKPGSNPAIARCLGAAAVVAIALVVWVACLKLPFMSSVVHYFGNTIQRPLSALGRTLLLGFAPFPFQPLLAVVVAIGFVGCIRKHRFWILAPALYMALAYFVVRTQNNALTHFLGGFWYNDHVRIGAALSLFLMPIAATGLASIAHAASELAKRSSSLQSTTRQRTCSVIAVGIVCICLFMPDIYLPGRSKPVLSTEFGKVYTDLHNMYKQSDSSVYGSDEQDFVDRARGITGDEVVLNYPADGSTFAYPVNDMNVYYRTLKIKGQTNAADAIRLKLDDYATDESVQKAVKTSGAHYLLKLDQGVSYEDGNWFSQFRKPENYAGIENVGDDTPGFTVVLSDGDMRLYRINDL